MPADFEISPLITPVSPEVSEPVLTEPANPSVSVFPADMKKKSNQMLKWLVVFAAGLVVFTIGMLLFGSSSFSDKNVSLTLEAPDHATSGDSITYTVKYANNTKVPLTKIDFRLFYPQGAIVLKDGVPTTPDSDGFTIDTLNPGESGAKEFPAFVVGDKGSVENAKATVVYTAGTLKSPFQKEATVATTITALPISLILGAPPTSVSGQPIEYSLDIRNDSSVDQSGLKVVLTYPDGFVVQRMNPAPSSGNTTWNLNTLQSSGGMRITIDGVLSGNERDTKTVTADVQRNLNGQYVDYVRTDAYTVISSPLLSVTVAPDQGRNYVSFPGDTLKYTITYSNNSRFTLIGLALNVKLDGDMYDTSGLHVDHGTFSDSAGTLAFDPSGVPDFSSLPPGKTGTLTFSIPLKTSTSAMGGAKTFFVKATARFSTSNVPTGVDGSEVFATDSVVTRIGSQPSLTQDALYDNGAGSGSIPAKVGSTTTYTIRWQLTNPGNDIRDAKVTAALPPGVTFVGTATATNGTAPTYDSTRNILTWAVGTLPYGTGNGTARYGATFQVSITPSSNLVGTSPKLITNAALTGTDSFTNQAVSATVTDVTTDNVQNHTDSGRVVQ